jgi:hypothetical protein
MLAKTLDWHLIIILSAFGLIMGLLSVKGFTQKSEPFLWLFITIISVVVLLKNIEHKIFLHGLITGLSWGILNALVQSVFFEIYLANNPSYQDNFQKITFIQPRFFPLITGPFTGLITGLILGGMSLLLKKIW